MKKFLLLRRSTFIGVILSVLLSGELLFADDGAGLYSYATTMQKIRDGNFTMNDIPMLIVSVINNLLLVVGSICVVAIIYHAVRMQIASGVFGDASGVDKAKKGVFSAAIGFILSMSAWFIMARLISIFSGN